MWIQMAHLRKTSHSSSSDEMESLSEGQEALKVLSDKKDRCGVAQLVARQLAVRQARVRFSARHHREGLPTERTKR
jgi:hypothetical protein